MALRIDIPLNDAEQFILKELFESSLSKSYLPHFQTSSLLQECENAGFSKDASEEALECLIDRGLLTGQQYLHGHRPSIHFTDHGFSTICESQVLDYDQKKERVARHLSRISDEKEASLITIAAQLDMPVVLTSHFIEFFVNLGWVRWQREHSEYAHVVYISPLLARAVEES